MFIRLAVPSKIAKLSCPRSGPHQTCSSGPHNAWNDTTWAVRTCLPNLSRKQALTWPHVSCEPTEWTRTDPNLGHSSFIYSGGLDLAQTWFTQSVFGWLVALLVAQNAIVPCGMSAGWTCRVHFCYLGCQHVATDLSLNCQIKEYPLSNEEAHKRFIWFVFRNSNTHPM